MAKTSIDWLFDPLSINSFFDEFYESKHLLIQGRSPDYYKEILSIKDIDDFFDQHRIAPQSILVTKDHQSNIEDWTNFKPGRSMEVDKEKIFSALHNGRSLVLHGLQQYVPGFHRFTDILSSELMCNVNSNIYITPPSERAFIPHIDLHDVIVLQIHGQKNWRFYEHRDDLPDESFFIRKTNEEKETPSLNFTLTEGDLLYIPRGIRHDAVTTSGYSIHVTIGLHPIRWIDIIKKSLVRYRESSHFRKSFPFWKHNKENSENDLIGLKEALNSWINGLNHEELASIAFNLLSKEKIKGYDNRFTDILSFDKLTGDDYVIARNPKFITFKKQGNFTIVKSLGGLQNPFPVFLESTLHSLLSGKSVQVNKLNSPLDVPDKLKLVKKLIALGLIKIDR